MTVFALQTHLLRVEQEKEESEKQLQTRLHALSREMADTQLRMSETHSLELMELKRTHTFRLERVRNTAVQKLAGMSLSLHLLPVKRACCFQT
jgi:hypothetical protein